jgi:hypothetical protein
LILTAGRQLSSHVSEAEAQVTEYRQFLMQRYTDVSKHFPNFTDPDCLIVVGLERSLDDGQKNVLTAINHARSRLRIVGFDWLSDRAAKIAANLINHGPRATRARII